MTPQGGEQSSHAAKELSVFDVCNKNTKMFYGINNTGYNGFVPHIAQSITWRCVGKQGG